MHNILSLAFCKPSLPWILLPFSVCNFWIMLLIYDDTPDRRVDHETITGFSRTMCSHCSDQWIHFFFFFIKNLRVWNPYIKYKTSYKTKLVLIKLVSINRQKECTNKHSPSSSREWVFRWRKQVFVSDFHHPHCLPEDFPVPSSTLEDWGMELN